MKSALLPLLSVLALALAFGGCEKTAPAPDEATLFQAIQDNVKAFEKKDVDAVMATIHPQSPSFAATRDLVGQMFQSLDFKCTLSDLKVVTASPDEARVSFVQKTEKTGGDAPFPNNIEQGIHTLRPDNGKWKIFGTLITRQTDLDGNPLAAPESSAPAPEPPPAPTPAAAPPSKPATPAEKPAP